MKILNFIVNVHQESAGEFYPPENPFFSDLPGFMRDYLLPVPLSPEVETKAGDFSIYFDKNDFQLIHKGKKNNIENYQALELGNNIVINIVSKNIDEPHPEQEREENLLIKNVIAVTPKAMPKISTEYVLINDYFSASRIKGEFPNGDILRDLGFLESRNLEMNSLIKF